MQQIFVVCQKRGEKASNATLQLSLLEHICALCGVKLTEVKMQNSAVDNDFVYYLLALPHPVSSEIEAKLKEQALQNKLPAVCDLLFSEDFPCFSEADVRCGAVVMDMDMTTVQIEGIDEIARKLGVFDEVAAITHDAMHGKLDFSQSLRRRVALLKGGDAAATLAAVKKIMRETDGLNVLLPYCNELKSSHNFKTCIASGGFHELICVIDEKYGLSHIAANRLSVDADGKFTGEVDGPIVDGNAKAQLVRDLKEQDGVPQERIIVIGDGANDLLMMQEGGLGIAYHAKPTVQEKARNVLNYGNLSAVAHLLQMRAQL